jgi:predicted AAA+ superfamily ATPase
MAELGDHFELEKALERGLLPEAYFAPNTETVHEYLKSYVFTYLEKEIQQEQWVRNIEPFRKFLQVAAQMNSKIINKQKIADQVGVESTTVESYFEILEDTLVAFRLPSFHSSIRKQLRLSSKFYFVDTGIVRALEKTLGIPMITHSSHYGSIFENFIILEVKKFIESHRLEWSLSYLRTRDDVEIDLVVSRPQRAPLLIEIKSTKKVTDSDIASLLSLGSSIDKDLKTICPKILVSQDSDRQQRQGVDCIFYKTLNKALSEF